MKNSKPQKTFNQRSYRFMVIVLSLTSTFLYSFFPKVHFEDIFIQLGITKTNAEKKIINSILGGSFDQFGVMNAKNIALAKRAAVTRDLLDFVKKETTSVNFVKQYNDLRNFEKPQPVTIQTPEQFRTELIDRSKRMVTDVENNLKKADATTKPIFEQMAVDAKKQLKDAEDPNNRYVLNYRKNYDELVKNTDLSNKKNLSDWEAKFPSNHMLFVKKRLEQFLEETNDIDYSAKLVEKNGKKYFADQQYERKSNRWKMAYRAGNEVTETARTYVQEWIKEIR